VGEPRAIVVCFYHSGPGRRDGLRSRYNAPVFSRPGRPARRPVYGPAGSRSPQSR
jgi:hypothetical protein